MLEDWALKSPTRVNIDSLTTSSGTYNGLLNIGISSAYPVFEGYKDYSAAGYRFNFSDPVGFHSGDLTMSVTTAGGVPENERYHVKFNYSYLYWKMSVKYNHADFYDFFGPTKLSRKGYSIGLSYKDYFLYDVPRTVEYTVYANYYGNQEKMPDYQNVNAAYDRFLNFGASLQYKFITSSLGSVDDEKGLLASIALRNNYLRSRLYPQVLTNFDYGFQLPINHSSIWLRGAAGIGIGDRNDPFANFFFGGFGNNYIDHGSEKRFREFYSFPGVELNSIAGKNFGKAIIEWILPPVRFKSAGISSFYLTWINPALFASSIITNIDDRESGNTFYNAGFQLDFRFNVLSNLKLTFSAGFAMAFNKNIRPEKEWMFSLKIL